MGFSRGVLRVGIYDDLGIKPIINASATLTKLGGSRMPEEVLDAMQAAILSEKLKIYPDELEKRDAVAQRHHQAHAGTGEVKGVGEDAKHFGEGERHQRKVRTFETVAK